MKSIFREYDIRGIFQKELNEKNVKLIGYFLGLKIKEQKKESFVALGYDARVHSPTLKDWLACGFNDAGVKVLDMGLVATPVNYFAGFQEFGELKANATVMITGSHNPPEYNGFKITINNYPFFGEDIYSLGATITQNSTKIIGNNSSVIKINAKKMYIDYISNAFSHLKGMKGKFVFDCGNGVAGVVLEDILDNLHINYELLYKEPDGTFPNHHPDPSEEHNLEDIKEELKKGYDFGFAYDGDADRIAMLSKKYNFKGDVLAMFFASKMKNPTIIGEVKCSQIMYDEINKIGKAIMYKTGHSNLKVKIKHTKADLAAEVSGHLFFNDRYFGFDDAIYATMRALELINEGFDFDKKYEELPKLFSTDEIKIPTTEEKKFEIIAKLKQNLANPPSGFLKIKDIIDIDGVRVIFEEGWGLVRASNTTPVLVTRFEAKSQEALKEIQESMTKMIEISK
ncbi:MAG: phosphomannomutase / phosphoglucomutase [Campylobacterota bacterium]|nr:phosphomannomutase / phosphoglucomutase [Campylobacterota bacterium]